MKRCSLSVDMWRRASARGALAVAALSALFLVGLLSPGATEGNSEFDVDDTVAKIQITYEGACVPGNLDTTISLTPITTSSPKPINVTGNVSGCFGTDALPGTVVIGNELFRYTNFYTETMSEIEVGVTSFPLDVEDCSDFVGTPSELYVGGERMTYSGMDCSGGPADTITINGRPEGSAKKHVVGSLVRAQGKLKLVARGQPRYAGGGSEADTTPAEHSGQVVKSPVTYLTCRGRLDQTSVEAESDPVSSRSRCYAILEPGYDPPQAPANRYWPDPYPGPLLSLIPVFYHEQATGDIYDQDPSSTTQLFMTAEYALYRCFAFVEDQLWLKITTDITVDKAPNEDLGVFRISLYTQGGCTGDPDFVLEGPDSMNFRSTEIAADTDSDGDGCADFRELDPDERNGGKRDPFNPWDYFNPTKDLRNRIDDVLAVIANYRVDNPPATDQYDRTGGRGPSDWNLGPPNGTIRIGDVLASIFQYRHDCPLPSP